MRISRASMSALAVVGLFTVAACGSDVVDDNIENDVGTLVDDVQDSVEDVDVDVDVNESDG